MSWSDSEFQERMRHTAQCGTYRAETQRRERVNRELRRIINEVSVAHYTLKGRIDPRQGAPVPEVLAYDRVRGGDTQKVLRRLHDARNELGRARKAVAAGLWKLAIHHLASAHREMDFADLFWPNRAGTANYQVMSRAAWHSANDARERLLLLTDLMMVVS